MEGGGREACFRVNLRLKPEPGGDLDLHGCSLDMMSCSHEFLSVIGRMGLFKEKHKSSLFISHCSQVLKSCLLK